MELVYQYLTGGTGSRPSSNASRACSQNAFTVGRDRRE